MLLSLFLGRTRIEETFILNALWWLNIDLLPYEFSVSISCNSKTKFHYELQTYNTNIVNDIKSRKNCSKNNLHSALCKPGFPNSSLEDDLIEFSYIFHTFSHPRFSTDAINSIKKQGKPRVIFILYTLQNSQNDLCKTSKNKVGFTLHRKTCGKLVEKACLESLVFSK